MVVTLFIDYFGLFIGKDFRVGLGVVPILLLANLFLGIYVNLSIWYKLTDRTMTGAYVSLGGALLTIVLNVLLIPKLGYMGSAYATLVCYASMAGVSYLLGQKFYPVPYDFKKIGSYLHQNFFIVHKAIWGIVFFIFFLIVVWLWDGRKLRQMIK
jgi:O-antigen/teichoic acid export membrane protein